LRNPVAKNNKHRGGPFNRKDKEGKSYVNQKIKKELDELDEEWIEDELGWLYDDDRYKAE